MKAVKAMIALALFFFGICLIGWSVSWLYFTLAGGTEQELIAQSSYAVVFSSWLFFFEIPALSMAFYSGVIMVLASIFGFKIANKRAANLKG